MDCLEAVVARVGRRCPEKQKICHGIKLLLPITQKNGLVKNNILQNMCLDISTPLNYYAVFHHMQELLPKG